MSAKALLSRQPAEFSSSCLFISKFRLQRVHCPFQVICIKPVRNIKEGEKKQVDKVLSWDTGTILYFIEDKLYPHHSFNLQPPRYFVMTNLE
jgi:hypothetical protein